MKLLRNTAGYKIYQNYFYSNDKVEP